MKTAMQQLIEILELAKGAPIPTNVKTQFLAKERQQIIDAAKNAVINDRRLLRRSGFFNSPVLPLINASDYYNQTYNNESE